MATYKRPPSEINETKRQRRVTQKRKIGGNRLFDVFLENLEETGGSAVPDYLVVRPRSVTHNLITGVSVLPVQDGKVGLIKVYRHPVAEVLWEIPRGFIDDGETAEEAATRELLEETGISAPSWTLQTLGIVSPEPGLIAGRIHMFLAMSLSESNIQVSGEFGHEGLAWFTQAKALEMVESGQIQDPSSVISIFRQRYIESS